MKPTTYPLTLLDSYMLTGSVKHFVFQCHLNPPFQYLPGQFITFHFEKDGQMLRRSYSIANPPEGNNLIEFAAGFVENGPASELLFHLKPQETLQFNGPFGRLICKEDTPIRYVFVATSTGVTPYRSMIPSLSHLLSTHPGLSVVILQGVQKHEDVLYEQDFNAFSQAFPERVRFHPCLSRVNSEDLKENQYAGYVQNTFEDLRLNPETDKVYLCGNPAMIDDSFEKLKEKGFTIQQIVREKYISR